MSATEVDNSTKIYSVYRFPLKGGAAEHVGDYPTDFAAWDAAAQAANSIVDGGDASAKKIEFCRSMTYTDKNGREMIVAVVKRR